MKPSHLLLFYLLAVPNLAFATLNVSQLRCEYLETPLAIETQYPRLSWILTSDQRGVKQTAYQILVASSIEQLNQNEADLWNSGKIPGDQTNQIEYNGKPLTSRQDCYWKIRVWDQDKKVSDWSKTGYWKMGLLTPKDWQAHWIGFDNRRMNKDPEFHLPPSPYYRKGFQTENKVKRAFLYVTALGLYEARINGQKVGDDFYSPGWTDYDQRLYYQTYNVTKMVENGENAIGLTLSNGWYAGYVGYAVLVGYPHKYAYYGEVPKCLVQLEIEYENGERKTIASDADWKVNTGPITSSDLLMGESYDARLELNGWDQAGYDESGWKNSRRMIGHLGKLESFPGNPVQIVETIEPIEITEPEPEKYIFNMGTNFAGIIRLNVKGKAGTKLTFRYGEMLHPNGRLMTENLRKARAIDTYILKGDPTGETWEPRFTYHGFQYVEVSGLTEKPEKALITGLVQSSATPRTSTFSSGHKLINQLSRNIIRTQFANYFDIPTDCPQRDERMGWTGDAQVYIRTATYNANVAAFHTKWITDLNDAQLGNGAYPNFAPFAYHRPNTMYSPAWMDAGIICPYTIYQVYGDTRIIEHSYPHMQALLHLYEAKSKDFLLPEDAFDEVHSPGGYGDWLNQGKVETSKIFIGNAYWLYDLKLMQEMATALGKIEDAKAYNILFHQVQEAFLHKYVDEKGTIKNRTQTACAMAINMGILPSKVKSSVAKQLVELVAANGGRLETGFVGVSHLLPALSQMGYQKEALNLFTYEGFPSWLYEVVNGATSIWERWDSYTIEDGFGGKQNSGMNSFSHYAFGAVGEWMYRYLAGIDLSENAYRQIRIRPEPSEALSPLSASYHSINGEIRSEWTLNGKDLELRVTIPANTTGEIWIPASNEENVTESGLSLSKAKSVEIIGWEGQYLKVKVGSGTYHFLSKGI